MTSDHEFISNAQDRIAVLEQLVMGLCRKAGAHEPYIKMWRENVANWPDVKNPLSTDAQYLVDWARSLK
jgi:hypothetical protein